MHKTSYYIVNVITWYRLFASFLLLYLLFVRNIDAFKWLLAFSFFTDAIDGYLARRFRVTSVFGSRLDSVADDLTVLMAIIGVFVFKPEFIRQERVLVTVLIAFYLIQLVMALIRYGKISSFHTYLAKAAAVLQGIFLILLFFLPQCPSWLFYLAAGLTFLDLMEEIILVLLLPQWTTDVKGIFWIPGLKH